jgi:hypothetical protein
LDYGKSKKETAEKEKETKQEKKNEIPSSGPRPS